MQTLFSYCSNVHDHHHTVMRDSFKHSRVLSNSYIFLARGIESKHESNRIFSSIFISHARTKTSVRIRIQITNNLKICFECEENIRNAGKMSCLSGDTHSIDLLHGAYTNLVFCDDIKETQNNCAIEYIVENWVCLRCRCRYTWRIYSFTKLYAYLPFSSTTNIRQVFNISEYDTNTEKWANNGFYIYSQLAMVLKHRQWQLFYSADMFSSLLWEWCQKQSDFNQIWL